MTTKSQDTTREGGREEREALQPPELSGDGSRPARNSSGSALASNLLDMRQKINLALELLEIIAGELGNDRMVDTIKRSRQQGFRRGR